MVMDGGGEEVGLGLTFRERLLSGQPLGRRAVPSTDRGSAQPTLSPIRAEQMWGHGVLQGASKSTHSSKHHSWAK